MTYWQSLIIGGFAVVFGYLGTWKIPKDRIWWPLALLIFGLGVGMLAVTTARLRLLG